MHRWFYIGIWFDTITHYKVNSYMMQLQHLIKRIKSSDIGRRMASGAFWSFTGTALAKLIVLVAGIVCAHVLSKQEYGEFGLVRSTISMFVVFGAAGLGVTASKYISQYRSDSPERIPSIYLLTNGFAWVTGSIMAVIVILSAPYIANDLLHADYLTNAIRVGALLLFVTVLNGAQNGTITGFEDFKSIAINTLIGSVFESVFMILGAYKFGVIGAVLGYGTGYIALYICNYISIVKLFNCYDLSRSFRNFSKKDVSLLYKYSLPAMLSSLVVAPTYWALRTMLASNAGFEELALYEAADQWKIIMMFIPSTLSSIILPILSSVQSEGYDKFWKVLKINLLLNGGISLCVAIAVSLFSPIIMHLYGSNYVGGELTIIVLAISTIFAATSNVVGLSIYSTAKMWTGFLFNTIWALLTLLFGFIFVKNNMGALGIALAITIAYILHSIYQFAYLDISIKNKMI